MDLRVQVNLKIEKKTIDVTRERSRRVRAKRMVGIEVTGFGVQ